MLVYTSGTTGQPKGVMMSQDNLTWTVRAAEETYDWNRDLEEGVSYLPLSHVAAQVIDIYLAAYGGATIWFADDQALQGSLIHTLKVYIIHVILQFMTLCTRRSDRHASSGCRGSGKRSRRR
jgi:long-chain-fatty-acid--CoA ligase ACSBG